MKQTEKKIEEGNKQAGVWVNIIKGENKTLPPEGKEVIFDGTEIPPIWGSIKYNGIFPAILCYESSGEEDYEDVWKYDRWLDEQPIPVNQDSELFWNQIINFLDGEYCKNPSTTKEEIIRELQGQYSIQLKSSPSPVQVREDEKEK